MIKSLLTLFSEQYWQCFCSFSTYREYLKYREVHSLRNILFFLLLCFNWSLFAQNAKQHFKAGEQFFQNGMVDAAIEELNKSLQLDPNDGKTYTAVAEVLLFTGDTLQAAEKYKRAAALGSEVSLNYFYAAKYYYQINLEKEALVCIDLGLQTKPKDIDLLLLKTKIYFFGDNFLVAYQVSKEALNAKEMALAYYYNGASAYRLGLIAEAERSLERSIIRDRNLADAYLTIAEIQIEQEKFEYAVDNCTMVLLLMNPESIRALVLRSRAYKNMKEPDDAIDDITKAIGLSNNDFDLILERAQINLDYALYANAIHDYSIALNISDTSITSLKSRAYAYEQLGKKAEALSDYQLLYDILERNYDKTPLKDYALLRIYELGKEKIKPELHITSPTINDKLELSVNEGESEIRIEGRIVETTALKELKVNNVLVPFERGEDGNYSFTYNLSTESLDFISISAVDIYSNQKTESFPISYVETDAPIIELISPVAGTAGIIQLETDDNTLYIEGRIMDKSNISSIKIDEVNASYTPSDYNPRFTATINARNRKNITVIATDVFGNESKQVFEFAKDGHLLSSNNPMGKTWVVIVENTNYEEYTNLVGPAKDVVMLTESLRRYQISRVLHKKDMTKRELERFFAIDLRDLIISNQVNSLLIWYAGHGQNVSDIGYWIPVDGRQNDEYSFYNINALKASLYSYQSLTHTLVVSDACYAGESFSIAMRGVNNSLETCNNLNLISQKSAIVLTSSNHEVAMDNSLFTRTFSNALANNPADCIPIDAIAERVSIVMYKNTAQKPVFGRIAGLEDKNGTFFFITK